MSTPLTWLYVPGDRPERFAKAAASGADVVIADLEDAVAPADKDSARAAVADYLAARPGGPPVHVRINDGDRGRADLAALAGLPGLSGVRVPKVESAAGLDTITADLPDHLRVHTLIESARGIAALDEIAAHPRVAGIGLGEQDLVSALAITAPAALDHLRLRAVLAAAAAGLPAPAMSVFANVRDEAGLLAGTRHGRELGMFGRSVIHPRQVPVVREAFAPTGEEVERAREIVRAADATGARGALALPDGTFVDQPIVDRARRVLDLAARLSG
ncbi:CoA ester lyase [Amycolatopsis endophytica]|uniref:Citrate lyase subunit beta/citryl-CoA lyase n=1 Tax=Amycolatopsis endophytica TaxID=860233 RepID=A0A853B8N1_9PSEU|nr:CoA ester lyase [Amycolatopsis endophytica]NYI91479.1 citrate lyase subunit beta/citryl-CoA lyase [Amycolatopsis endophytica]